MKKGHPDYIVVEGPIGVGKTTLAKRLAKTFKTELMLELAAENPFLPRFYSDPKSVALPTQLFFLFQRARQIESLRQTDMFRSVQVSDFLIEKDKLFASVTLDDDELALYHQVYERLTIDAPVPDLVIYLQAPIDILMQRIIERGHDYERPINRSYLKKISDAYVEFFYHYTTAPLLIVNTDDFDLSGSDKDYKLLLEHIKQLPPGRHYFNPIES
ncbi:MAG: deoxynucleoside kinase [Proteobacteria bacterium]|nr:deoxynucleoside kinase [Pseudomonadota bacterium]